MLFLFQHSSLCMDSADMPAIFQISVEEHNTHYVEFLGDGDSKAHNLLVQENVYGDVEILKFKCAGHVQKCLSSTHLVHGKAIGRK